MPARPLHFHRVVVLAFLATTVAAISGCATPGFGPRTEATAGPAPLTHQQFSHRDLGGIALVSADEPTKISVGSVGLNWVQGALAGGAGGAAVGAGAALYGGAPAAGPIGLAVIGAMSAVGLVAGVVTGIVTADSFDTLSEAQAVATRQLAAASLQTRFLDLARNHATLNHLPGLQPSDGSPQSADTVLELGITEISVSGALEMKARARLVNTASQRVLHDATYVYRSANRAASEWTDSNVDATNNILDTGIRDLARKAVDEALFLFGYIRDSQRADRH